MLSDKNSIYWSPNCVKHYTIIIPDTFYFILLITQWQGFSTLPFYSRENWVSKKISISPFPYSGRTRTWIQSCPNSRSKLLTTILHAPLESNNGFVISPGSNLRLSSSGYAWTREDLGSLWPPSMDIIRGRRDRGKLFPNFNWHQPAPNTVTGLGMSTLSHIPGFSFEQLEKRILLCWHVMIGALGGSPPGPETLPPTTSRPEETEWS